MRALLLLTLFLVACGDDTSVGGGGHGGGATTVSASTGDSTAATQAGAGGEGGSVPLECAPHAVPPESAGPCFATPGCTVVLLGNTGDGVCTTTCESTAKCLDGDTCYIETSDDGVCLDSCEVEACAAPLRCEDGVCKP